MVTGTTSPSTRYERISVSPASCSIKSEYVIASHAFKPQYKCINYTPAWEQRKFGDCFEFLKSNTLSRAGLNGENGTARNVHYGDILIKFGDCLDDERSDLPFITDDTVLPKYAGSILREGDVIFADTAEDETAGKCVELRKLPKEPTISGLHTIPARPRFPFGTGYLGHYLNSDAYHRQLLPLMQGIKVISVSKAALQDTQVRFPGLSEQSAIGAALNEIDSLITLHQRKRQWLKWLDEGGEGTHHDIDILVFKFADDMKISVLCGVHACMTKSLGHTGNRYAGKQQQRGMGVP